MISIIIPIYNVEAYLERCVESVRNQTYADLEIILVDDGSPDRCPEICDQLAEQDNRIKVIHQENKGLSGARNVGMKIAKGEFVLFLDSDDYISSDCCQKLIEAIKDTGSDVAVSEITCVNEYGEKIKNDSEQFFESKVCWDNNQTIREYIRMVNLRGFAWGKLFRRELLEGIAFVEGKVYEDRRTVPLILKKSKQMVLVPGPQIYYCIRPGSITNNNSNLRKWYDLISAEEENIKFIKKNYPELLQQMISIYFGRFVHIWICFYDSKNEKMTSEFTSKMKEVYAKYSKNQGIRNIHKASYKAIFMVPAFYRKAYKIVKKV